MLMPESEQPLLPLGGGLLAAVLHELTGEGHLRPGPCNSTAAAGRTRPPHHGLLPNCRRVLSVLSVQPRSPVLLPGPAHRSVNLDCVELLEPSQALLRGPWSLRNLHPTTRLLHWLPRAAAVDAFGPSTSSSTGPGGGAGQARRGELLVVSSSGVLSVASGSSSGGDGGEGAGPRKREVVAWRLTGLPSAIAAVGAAGRRLVVGDDAGGEADAATTGG
jgi:hypothetical protein